MIPRPKIMSDAFSRNMTNISELKRQIRENFKVDAYGQSYVDSMEQAYSEYGEDGIKSQLLYILSNAKAITPLGKELRKKWQSGII